MFRSAGPIVNVSRTQAVKNAYGVGWLFTQSSEVVLQNRVLSHLWLSGTFHLNVYFYEKCQESRKLMVEGNLLNETNPTKEHLWGSLLTESRGLG